MLGGIENVFVENLTFGKIRQIGIQFKSNKDRGGYTKNIKVEQVEKPNSINNVENLNLINVETNLK